MDEETAALRRKVSKASVRRHGLVSSAFKGEYAFLRLLTNLVGKGAISSVLVLGKRQQRLSSKILRILKGVISDVMSRCSSKCRPRIVKETTMKEPAKTDRRSQITQTCSLCLPLFGLLRPSGLLRATAAGEYSSRLLGRLF